jgi:hypothetical protein
MNTERSVEEKVFEVVLEAGVVEELLFVVLPVLAFDHAELVGLVGPAGFASVETQVGGDHLVLCVEGVLHPGDDVLVGLGFGEGEGVDFVAGDGGELAYLFEDVFGEVLAAGFDDVAFVFEDVVEGSAK